MPEMPGSVSRLFAVGVVFFVGAFGAGCASTGEVEVEMSKMRREMAQMKKDLADAQLSIQRLESQVTILSLGRDSVDRAPTTRVASASSPQPKASSAKGNARSTAASAPGKAAPRSAAPSAKAASPVLPVVRLTNKAEAEGQGQDESWVEPGAQDDGSPPITIALKGEEEPPNERLAVDHDVLRKPDPLLAKSGASKARGTPAPEASAVAARPAEPTRAEIETEYANALARLRNDHDPKAALALFVAFKERHPRAALVDNAEYWTAECHYAMKAYAQAIEGFERLVKEHPKSRKSPDALLRIGESWLAMSQPVKAKPIFEQVISRYPKSEAASHARVELDAMVQ